jgi:hypothetical protein
VVWAPLVDIPEEFAQQLDRELARYCAGNPNGSIDTFMRDRREEMPTLKLYVRYGLHTKGVVNEED